jgi:hypothetical protein
MPDMRYLNDHTPFANGHASPAFRDNYYRTFPRAMIGKKFARGLAEALLVTDIDEDKREATVFNGGHIERMSVDELLAKYEEA